MTTSMKFRDYSFDLDHETYLDTSGGMATFLFTDPDAGRTVFAQLDRDGAREVGTDLLHWTGSPLTCTLDDVHYTTTNGSEFSITCTDGIPEITIRQDGDTVSFTPQYEAATDIGQRLIVFAGVDVHANIPDNR